MNKAEFVDRIAARTGDRAAAKEVVDVAIDEIQRAVVKGEKVSFAGFGVFEKRQRAARMARNPRTGEAVKVRKTVVPAFRPGTGFKELVTGKRKAAKSSAAKKAAPAKKTTAKKAAKKAAKKTTRAASAGNRSMTTGRVTAKKSAAKKTTAKKAARKAAPAKKTAAGKAAAKKTTKRGRR